MRRLSLLPLFFFGTVHCCFVRGTDIATPRGPIPIEQLRIGDEVLAFREHDHAVIVRRVVAIHRARVSIVREVVVSGKTIVTTDEHPFWDAERRRWTAARDLERGIVLARRTDNGSIVPATVEHVSTVTRSTAVFNLTVDGEHTYFAEGIAVHNKTEAEDCGINPGVCAVTSSGTLANQSNGSLSIGIAAPPTELAIDQALLAQGADPLAAEIFGATPATTTVLAGRSTAVAPTQRASVTILGNPVTKKSATVVSFTGSAGEGRFLVVGDGPMAIRNVGAELVLVPLDANATVFPIRRNEKPACAAADVTTRLEWSEGEIEGSIMSQQWTNGCVQITLLPSGSFRACLPQAAWPFAVNNAFHATPVIKRPRPEDPNGALETGVDFSNGAGTLELRRVTTAPTAYSPTFGKTQFTVAPGEACATFNPACSSQTMTLDVSTFGSGGNTPVSIGSPFERTAAGYVFTHWVVAAYATPIGVPFCGDKKNGYTLEVVTYRQLAK